MKKENQNRYKLDFARTSLFTFNKNRTIRKENKPIKKLSNVIYILHFKLAYFLLS